MSSRSENTEPVSTVLYAIGILAPPSFFTPLPFSPHLPIHPLQSVSLNLSVRLSVCPYVTTDWLYRNKIKYLIANLDWKSIYPPKILIGHQRWLTSSITKVKVYPLKNLSHLHSLYGVHKWVTASKYLYVFTYVHV